jgi:hypothetical protein
MLADNTLHTFARCRTLALKALIDAGGHATLNCLPAAPAASGTDAQAVGLSAHEREQLRCFSPNVLAVIERTLGRLPAAGSRCDTVLAPSRPERAAAAAAVPPRRTRTR